MHTVKRFRGCVPEVVVRSLRFGDCVSEVVVRSFRFGGCVPEFAVRSLRSGVCVPEVVVRSSRSGVCVPEVAARSPRSGGCVSEVVVRSLRSGACVSVFSSRCLRPGLLGAGAEVRANCGRARSHAPSERLRRRRPNAFDATVRTPSTLPSECPRRRSTTFRRLRCVSARTAATRATGAAGVIILPQWPFSAAETVGFNSFFSIFACYCAQRH